MDPKKPKKFNSRLKVWDFAKTLASEFQNLSFDNKSSSLKKFYTDMLSKYSGGKGKIIFFLVFWIILVKFWVIFGQNLSQLFFCRANFIRFQEGKSCFNWAKQPPKNDRNINTKIVAATFENKNGSEEVSGENVWRNYEYFDARKSDYSMEKVNFPENTFSKRILNFDTGYFDILKSEL